MRPDRDSNRRMKASAPSGFPLRCTGATALLPRHLADGLAA
jgi:hypothetical protein